MSDIGKRILVVDDDLRLRDLLERYMTEQGFTVSSTINSKSMDQMLERGHYDALILDLMLPGEDGLSICRRLRTTNPELPILILTAKGDEIDRIIGLEMGADDYLSKPFNPRELVARLRAVLRRQVSSIPGAPNPEEEIVTFGNFSLNLGSRELFMGKDRIPLTSGEFAILKTLIKHPRHPLSRERLMELARGREHEAYDRSIDVQISRLRKLIEDDPAKPHHIQTVRGFGYVFVP